MRSRDRAIGIDAGGTHTRVLITDAAGNDLGSAEGGAGIVSAGTEEAVAEHMAALVREALSASAGSLEGPPDPERTALVAGVAGAGHERVRAHLTAALEAAGVARNVRVVTDLEVAFHDAFPEGPGVVLVAGTGSVALARDADGELHRVGGWGSVLGDEGSGYALGIAGLRAVLAAHDGRGSATLLATVLLDALGVPSPEDLVPWAPRAEKAAIASLAPLVAEVAADGDEVARDLVREALGDLRRLLGVACAYAGPGAAVVLGGGLILPGRPLREGVEALVHSLGARLVTRPLLPQRGAAALARELLARD
jgi:glucosamine kinase